MKSFSVKNFERFQHYKDRSPPWIKLYNELLDDYAFGCLQDASKLHLILIWLLASRSDNSLPYDAAWIGKRINATSKVDLDSLAQAGFLLINQGLEHVASIQLAPCKQSACPEREGETETETEEKPKKVSLSRAIDPNWFLSEDDLEYAFSRGWLAAHVHSEAERFRNHFIASGAKKKDWAATWRNWVTSPYQQTTKVGGHETDRERGRRATKDALRELGDYIASPDGDIRETTLRLVPPARVGE